MSADQQRIESLEADLATKEEELKVKTASFEEALSREQQKAKEREAKEAAKRAELQQQILDLTEERASIR